MLEILKEQEVLDKHFRVYGTADEPLFLAKDVAEWIGHSDASKMVSNIDEDEKLIRTLFVSGQDRDCLFVTEDGLYEVLMQSRKPIAKAFRKEIRKILTTIRKTETSEQLPHLKVSENNAIKEEPSKDTITSGLKLIENELVPVYITSTGEQVVNGRELWTVLGSKRQFTDWIKDRLEYVYSIENVDYQTFSQNCEKGRPSSEYIIKLDIAKEIAMLERNDKGKKVRMYFINIEKKYKQDNQPKLPMTYIEALEQLLASEKEKEQLKLENEQQALKIQEDAPKVSYYDIVINCTDLIPITMIAKDYGWSANKMNKYLEQKKVQYKFRDTWILYDEYAKLGYTGTKTVAFKSKTTDDQYSKMYTCWTQKGRLFIYNLLKGDSILPLIEKTKPNEPVTNNNNG